MFRHYQIKSSPSSFITPTHNLYNLQSFNPSTTTTNRPIQAHNLYISNLSLQTTEESLFQTVAQYGQVTHVCILSTLDSQGRRRAFIDLVDSVTAQFVIHKLDGSILDDYQINVSFAIVQRSGGFKPRYHHTPTMNVDRASNYSNNSNMSLLQHHQPERQVGNSSTIVISNLPNEFTSFDLSRLFDHYNVLYCKISKDVGVVIFGSEMEAERARRESHGRWIEGKILSASNWKDIQNTEFERSQLNQTQTIPLAQQFYSPSTRLQFTPPPYAGPSSRAQTGLVRQRYRSIESSQTDSNDSGPRTPTDSYSIRSQWNPHSTPDTSIFINENALKVQFNPFGDL